jgi:acyl-CoA thioester hydrolase
VPATFTFPVRVYYEDTDAAGVVYYANYLRYLERARTEWLAAAGHSVVELQRVQRIVFVVRRIEVEFRAAAHLEDRLDVTVALESLGRASLAVVQHVLRGREPIVTARVLLACVDTAAMKPVRIPIDLASLRARGVESPS